MPGSHLELHWLNPPRKILVVAKPSPDVLRSLVRVAGWLLEPARAMHVYVEPSVYARVAQVCFGCLCSSVCVAFKLCMILLAQCVWQSGPGLLWTPLLLCVNERTAFGSKRLLMQQAGCCSVKVV